MQKKRIAVISYHTCPLAAQEGKESGGMNIYVLELSKALISQGYKIDIFTRIQDIISPEIVNLGKDLSVIHLPAGPKHNLPKKKLINYIDKFSTSLALFISKKKYLYDYIHCHYYMSGLVALRLRKNYFFKQPIITTFHTLALMKNLVARNSREHESRLRINAEFDLVKESQIITASSQNDKDYLVNLYNCPSNKIHVIHPGVDSKIFKPIPKKEALNYIQSVTTNKIILFVGRIEPLKGIDTLMHAIKILQSKKPELKLCLLIVGGVTETNAVKNNPELARLKRLQKTLGISPIVGYVAQRHQHELPYYYNASEVVVMPSYYESFGMTALEAMSCGRPVIITNTSGISSIIDDEFQSLIVSANNPLQLANQI
ncbi:MAG: glycosyltransferase, partial [Candidatus Woesearchaeota archaeon]